MTGMLGWRLMLRDRWNSALAAGGIAAAVLIVFVEMGFLNGVVDSHLRVVSAVRGELVALDPGRSNLNRWDSLLPARLPQLAAIEGVAAVLPLYQAGVSFRGAPEQSDQRIIALAFSPDDPPLDLGWRTGELQALRQPGVVLMDRLSRSIYGELSPGQDLWLASRRVRLGGFVSLGPSVINDGFVIMSTSTFAALGSNPQPAMAVIRVAGGEAPARVQARIRERLGDAVAVFLKSELAERESTHLQRAAPLGLLFGAGMVAGLFVGLVICYQVLYVTVRRRLKAFATLKAMGFGDGFILRTVLLQALLLGAMGYAAGLALAFGAYRLLAGASGLLLDLSVPRAAAVGAASLAACAVAGAIAARKAMNSHPAELV